LRDIELTYKKPGDPLSSLLIGAFDFPSQGLFWFVESNFKVLAFHLKAGDTSGAPTMQSMSIDRDTSFLATLFHEMFSPVLVGKPGSPTPGVYVDSTLVRGDRVSVATWDGSGAFDKPLRYSMRIPSGCVNMAPIQFSSGSESFALPLLCQVEGNQIRYRIARP
jgi:hypothetical protein